MGSRTGENRPDRYRTPTEDVYRPPQDIGRAVALYAMEKDGEIRELEARCVRAEEALQRCFRYVPDMANVEAGQAGERIKALRREVADILGAAVGDNTP